MKFCRLPDGRRVTWREAGHGHALVMLHGWGVSSAVFDPVMAALSDRFRVLAPDLRGHGRSDPGQGYALDDLARDLELWLDLLGLSNMALLGWSLGGMVALRLEKILAARVARLILVATTPCFVRRDGWPTGQPAARVRALARQYRQQGRATLQNFFASQFHAEEVVPGKVRAWMTDLLPEGLAPCAQAALETLTTLRTADLRKDLAPAGCPALVVHGERDVIIPPAAGRYLAAHRKNSCFSLVPEAGHAPFLSRPDATLSCWREFLS